MLSAEVKRRGEETFFPFRGGEEIGIARRRAGRTEKAALEGEAIKRRGVLRPLPLPLSREKGIYTATACRPQQSGSEEREKGANGEFQPPSFSLLFL